MIVQQARAVQILPCVVAIGLPDPARAPRAPRPEELRRALPARVRRQADAAEVVAVQGGHGVRAAVAHCYNCAVQGVVALDRPAGDLLPQPAQVDCGRAPNGSFQALAVGVVAVALAHTAAADAAGPVLAVPGVAAVAAAEHVAVLVVAVVGCAVVDHRVALGQRAARAAGALGSVGQPVNRGTAIPEARSGPDTLRRSALHAQVPLITEVAQASQLGQALLPLDQQFQCELDCLP